MAECSETAAQRVPLTVFFRAGPGSRSSSTRCRRGGRPRSSARQPAVRVVQAHKDDLAVIVTDAAEKYVLDPSLSASVVVVVVASSPTPSSRFAAAAGEPLRFRIAATSPRGARDRVQQALQAPSGLVALARHRGHERARQDVDVSVLVGVGSAAAGFRLFRRRARQRTSRHEVRTSGNCCMSVSLTSEATALL